jgi:hypothetical protein
MSEMTTETVTETAATTAAEPTTTPEPDTGKAAAKKKGRRKPIFVLVPRDIEDLNAEDVDVAAGSPGTDEAGKKLDVQAVSLGDNFHVYVVPPGTGQKAAIRGILTKHNVDIKTIGRVKMFAGQKHFSVETQYNIRF